MVSNSWHGHISFFVAGKTSDMVSQTTAEAMPRETCDVHLSCFQVTLGLLCVFHFSPAKTIKATNPLCMNPASLTERDGKIRYVSRHR